MNIFQSSRLIIISSIYIIVNVVGTRTTTTGVYGSYSSSYLRRKTQSLTTTNGTVHNETAPPVVVEETNVTAPSIPVNITNETLTIPSNETMVTDTNTTATDSTSDSANANATSTTDGTNTTNTTNQPVNITNQTQTKPTNETIASDTNSTTATNSTTNTTDSTNTTNQVCTLEATLKYPYDDPDDAPYMGYQASWLLVYRAGSNNHTDYCDGGHHANITWCTYFNTGGPEADSAYVGNVDDYYTSWAATDDLLWTEIFTIEKSANSTFEMIASHWFFEEDYYSNYEEWSDHMLAPVLIVKNKETNATVMDEQTGASSWTHPVDMNVKTHVMDGKEFVPNEDYQGDFSIIITCTESCVCKASNYTLL